MTAPHLLQCHDGNGSLSVMFLNHGKILSILEFSHGESEQRNVLS